MKPIKKIQKKLEKRQNGYKSAKNGTSVWAKYEGAYRMPGSRNPHKS